MSIITITPEQNQGNTLKGAAMTAFNKSNQRDIKITAPYGHTMTSVYDRGVWVDYDTWQFNGNFNFLLAE
tara:strand:+ start:1172 stop:1381 length:210 start_codon:yes stop_codon:yes gene_type:complete